MAKEKENIKEAICQDCLSSSSDKGFDKYMFHWVRMEAGYQGLFCNKCIEKYGLISLNPYSKKPGRKKSSNDEKSDK